MDESRSPTAGLHELAQFYLPASAGLEQSLQQLAGVAAKIVDAASCSIMLLDERDEHDVRLRVFTAHGELPPAAFEEIARKVRPKWPQPRSEDPGWHLLLRRYRNPRSVG